MKCFDLNVVRVKPADSWSSQIALELANGSTHVNLLIFISEIPRIIEVIRKNCITSFIHCCVKLSYEAPSLKGLTLLFALSTTILLTYT